MTSCERNSGESLTSTFFGFSSLPFPEILRKPRRPRAGASFPRFKAGSGTDENGGGVGDGASEVGGREGFGLSRLIGRLLRGKTEGECANNGEDKKRPAH